MPLDAMFRLELSHCGISIVDWFGDRAARPLRQRGALGFERVAAVAIELDAVLGDTRPLYDAWLEDVSRRAHVDPDRLDEELPNWRVLLERFAEDHAPVYLRPSAPATAALRRLQADGVRIGVFTDAPDELARVAVAHLGAARRIEALEAGPGRARAAARAARARDAHRALFGRLGGLTMEGRHELTDRQLEALLERLDRLVAELDRMNRRQEAREDMAVDRARAAQPQRVAAGDRVRGARPGGPRSGAAAG